MTHSASTVLTMALASLLKTSDWLRLPSLAHGAMWAVLTLSVTGAHAQTLPAQSGLNEYKVGDYTLKLMNNDTAGQMWQGMKVVGTVYAVNGNLMFLPAVPEPDATKARKAFEDWKTSGKTGSQTPPPAPISFEPDGGAVVPLPDGSVVHFAPTYAEITQGNAMATIPGQAPVNIFKVALASPSIGKMLFKSSSGIYINGVEIKPLKDGAYAGGRKSLKLNAYYSPIVDGPMTTAAHLATADPKKPANALDYLGEVQKVRKRVNESF